VIQRPLAVKLSKYNVQVGKLAAPFVQTDGGVIGEQALEFQTEEIIFPGHAFVVTRNLDPVKPAPQATLPPLTALGVHGGGTAIGKQALVSQANVTTLPGHEVVVTPCLDPVKPAPQATLPLLTALGMHGGGNAIHDEPFHAVPLGHAHDDPFDCKTWFAGHVLATQLGLPKPSCTNEVPQPHPGSFCTQCAIDEPVNVQCIFAGHPGADGSWAHADGVSSHVLSPLNISWFFLHWFVLNVDVVLMMPFGQPSGHVFVVTVNFWPVYPASHAT
jgi:hypothetical protein